MVEPIKYKMRRLHLHVDDPGLLDQIEELASHLALTKKMIAPCLGVSLSTFHEFLTKPEAKAAFERGRARGRLSHAQLLDAHAKSDPRTAIFLAKQDRYLGMSDNPTTDKAVVQIAEVETRKSRTREELAKRALELLRKVPTEIDGEAEDVTPAPTGKSVARR